MLASVVCLNLLIQFHFGYTSIMDRRIIVNDVESNLEEQRSTLSSQDIITQLSEFQTNLQAIQETQALLMNKVNTLFDSEQKNTISNQKKTRFRRDAEGNPQTALPSPNGCIPGTFGCPMTVTPYSVAGSCFLCPAGPRGYPGPSGPPGRDGRDGRDSVGVGTADCGETPSNTPPNQTSGSVYVRWGHTECPSQSTLIYSGSAAGANHNAEGNGANQLCLPQDPSYDNPVAGVGTSRAFLYSLEYQIDSFPALQSHTWHDVSCAVCKSPLRFAQLMIPGKQTCPSGEWTLEYSGYLMTERSHPNHKRSMHICVDSDLRSVANTQQPIGNRAALNLVEARCISSGSGIPCGPYVDGYEMTCAVCTQ